MYRFGLVILNYLTLQDTELLLDRVYASELFNDVMVYVVDNASPDGSGTTLYNKYHGRSRTRIILQDKNVGFARALNTGMGAAREDGCDFVITTNSDIDFDLTGEFKQTVTALFENDADIALIGPRIIDLDGNAQSPFSLERPVFNRVKLRLVFTTGIGRVVHFFHFMLYGVLNLLIPRLDLNRMVEKSSGETCVYAVHGCLLIFTPAFFKCLYGFDEGTFLFQEEWILAEMLYRKKLKTFYTSRISATHKEGASIDRTCKGSSLRKLIFREKHNYASRSYLVKRYLLPSKA